MRFVQDSICTELLKIHRAAWAAGADTVAVTLPPAGWAGFGQSEYAQVAAVRGAVNERLPGLAAESFRTNGVAKSSVFDLAKVLSPQNESTQQYFDSEVDGVHLSDAGYALFGASPGHPGHPKSTYRPECFA